MTDEHTDPQSPPVLDGIDALTALAAGTEVGRYRIVAFAGAGGMGEVYRAHDPRLGRELAIKVLRPGSSGDPDGLMREARLMASFTHPNVLTVYEAGTIGEQLYLAMEYVDGRTLGAWLRERPRSWREIVATYVAAGRGLAAAHRAGVVHRDFKPDNVLVGRDGRVTVTDFGLAAPKAAAAAGSGGTPRYMAPEQRTGAPADERADQYAFCVALYTALAGIHPEEGAPGSGRSLPAHLREPILRGLRTDPAERHPSMAALLARLEHDPARVRRRVLVGLGLMALGGAAALVILPQRRVACSPGRERLDGVWDQGVKAAIHATFVATGKPYADATFTRVAEALDGYAGDWMAMHREACEATEVRHEQSSMLYDLRAACLDQRLASLRALTGLLARAPDVTVLGQAVQGAHQLEAVAGCADAEALTRVVPLPADAGTRARIAALRPGLDTAAALFRAGKFKDARAAVDPLLGEARAIDYPPLLSEALALSARAAVRAGDYTQGERLLHEALEAAARAKDDELVTGLWTNLIFLVGRIQRRHAEALAFADALGTSVARAGGSPLLEARFYNELGGVLGFAGRHEEALVSLRRGIALAEQGGMKADTLAALYNTLGLELENQGRYAEADTTYHRALALYEIGLGPAHPSIAFALGNLANVQGKQGRLAEAEAADRRAMAVLEGALGPDHADVGRVAFNLGDVLAREGRYEAALALRRRALEIKEKAFSPTHPEVALVLGGLGSDLFLLGRYDEALAAYRRALQIRTAAFGPVHEGIGELTADVGGVLLEQGKVEEARSTMEKALEIIDKSEGPGSPQAASTLQGLAELALVQGRAAEAAEKARRSLEVSSKIYAPDSLAVAGARRTLGGALLAEGHAADAEELLEKALAVEEKAGGDPRGLATTRFALARALWEEKKERGRALELARAAKETFAAGGEPAEPQLHKVTAWLHGR